MKNNPPISRQPITSIPLSPFFAFDVHFTSGRGRGVLHDVATLVLPRRRSVDVPVPVVAIVRSVVMVAAVVTALDQMIA